MHIRYPQSMPALVLATICLVLISCGSKKQGSGNGTDVPQTVLALNPTEENPRNGEGDFIILDDGRILFVYSHFTGGAADHAAACIAVRYSADLGLSWSDEDVRLFSNESGRRDF